MNEELLLHGSPSSGEKTSRWSNLTVLALSGIESLAFTVCFLTFDEYAQKLGFVPFALWTGLFMAIPQIVSAALTPVWELFAKRVGFRAAFFTNSFIAVLGWVGYACASAADSPGLLLAARLIIGVGTSMFPLCNVWNAAAYPRKEQNARAFDMMMTSYAGSAIGLLVASGAYSLGQSISIKNLVLSTITLPGWISAALYFFHAFAVFFLLSETKTCVRRRLGKDDEETLPLVDRNTTDDSAAFSASGEQKGEERGGIEMPMQGGIGIKEDPVAPKPSEGRTPNTSAAIEILTVISLSAVVFFSGSAFLGAEIYLNFVAQRSWEQPQEFLGLAMAAALAFICCGNLLWAWMIRVIPGLSGRSNKVLALVGFCGSLVCLPPMFIFDLVPNGLPRILTQGFILSLFPVLALCGCTHVIGLANIVTRSEWRSSSAMGVGVAYKLARAAGGLAGSYLERDVVFASFCLGTLLAAMAILLAVFPFARSYAKDA